MPSIGSGVHGLQQLPRPGSRTGSAIVANGLSFPQGMWDLPGSGVEPASPALAGRFFATEPPGKPLTFIFNYSLCFFFFNK